MVVDNHKTCPRCSQNLHTDNFYKTSRKSGDGFSGYCRACTTQKARDWQKENPEALAKIHAKRYAKFATGELVRTEEQKAGIRAASDSWRKRNIDKARIVSRESKRRAKERNPELYRAKQAIQFHRRRCEKKGYPSDVTVEDWLALLDVFGRACPFCGGKPAVLDLDHLMPIHLGGYNVVGNIVPICRPCNAQKSRKAPEVFAKEMNIELGPIVDKMRVRTSDHPTCDPATHNRDRN
mgnify:CR=1 FL=1